MLIRPRRLRFHETLRDMTRETRMSPSSLIYPIFIEEGKGIKKEISSMEGQYRYSVDMLAKVVEETYDSGIKSMMLFGIPEHKDEVGSEAYNPNGVLQEGIREIKRICPEMYVVTDVCMCEYTSTGHCGVLKGEYVDNDATLHYLSQIALSHIEAGADMVAPSDMMDGRIKHMRETLDKHGFTEAPIMSYSAKYASAFYGPFREAADSTPQFGDRKTYQMDYHNSIEAVKESAIDVKEGADILMVKPALSYLDVISKVKSSFDLPLAAYSVSGEYAMIKAAAKLGYIEEDKLIAETATSIFRAGADILITYYAKEIAQFIKEGRIG